MKQVHKISSWQVRVKPLGKASSLGKRMRRRKLAFIEHLHRVLITSVLLCYIGPILQVHFT